uniref:FBD domain-containing protein n=1 Tax=Arabidopsis thaliana TaxID=3702 RepID=Q9LHL4_ARATH|nr:unnamed protein product [Arabidopsis thaliana]
MMEKLIAGCPVLEDFALILPDDERHKAMPSLRVRSQTLKSFLFAFEFNTTGKAFAVEIDAPALKCMTFSDSQSDKIVLKNLNSLSMVDINSDFHLKYGKTLGPRKRNVIRDFLIGISSVRHMIISKLTLEVLFRYSKLGRKFPKFDNLTRLEATLSRSMLELFPSFLESFPNLKNLIVLSDLREAKEIKLSHVPQCMLLNLESVEINLQYGEIKRVIIMEETVKELVRYFLENSVVLIKKLILCFEDLSKANQDSDIFKELLKFTKLYPRCQIIIH